MKRRASSSCAACLAGSMSCICADAPRHDTESPCAATWLLTSPKRSGANSGTFVRSMFVWMPRSSTAANWCSAAKSRILGQGQVGQPRVEKPSGNFLGACQGSSSAAAVPTNSRLVVIVSSLKLLLEHRDAHPAHRSPYDHSRPTPLSPPILTQHPHP